MDWLKHFKSPPTLTFINHGEPHQSQALKVKIKTMEGDIKFEIGLTVYQTSGDNGWSITGNAKRALTVKEFDSAYDFEEFIQTKINCNGVEFDSEFCQFFAYTKTKARAIKFAKDIERLDNLIKQNENEALMM